MRVYHFGLGFRIDFPAQQTDEGIKGILCNHSSSTPYGGKNLGTRDDSAGIAYQQFQEPELRQRQINLAPAAKRAKRSGVEYQIAGFHNRLPAKFVAPHQSANSREQFLK